MVSFVSGWVGGVGAILVGHPFDTVKTLLQSNAGGYRNSFHCAMSIIRRGGARSLYKGVAAPVSGIGIVFALYFLSFDLAEKALRWFKGIDSRSPLGMSEVMICGGSSGVLGSLVLGPTELLKIRQQTALTSGQRSSLRGVVKAIYLKEGARGFMRGTGATMLRDVPGSMAWFGGYEYAKALLCDDPRSPLVSQALVAGGVGGVCMWSLALPLDAIKTRVQLNPERISSLNACRCVLNEYGIRGFYRGIGPVMLRALPANAVCFAARETVSSFLENQLTYVR
ncbi:putative mitochondrial carrier protein [Trypanosoma vivax]|nr:putative mitochondrial carrier protein [Trypanosoma vivax]